MKKLLLCSIAGVWIFIYAASGQTAQKTALRMVASVRSLKPETAEIELKPDKGDAVLLRFTSDSLVQRVAPGEKDLKHAEAMKLSDIAPGDRVLVVTEQGSSDIRRIVVMPAKEITSRDDADRQDWMKRGVSGVVVAKTGDQITLRTSARAGSAQATVMLTPETTIRRYSPDSVKFADARISNTGEISVGDQLRARGTKSADGLKVTAENVVFGTFQTKAGSITAVNAETREITIVDMATRQPLTIKLTADSQLKKMPDLGAMMAPGGNGPPAGMRPGAPPPGGPPGGPGGAPDLSQMLDHMPAATLDDLKPGDTIVVSSTKGNRPDQVTAIMLVSNAGTLIRMASAQQPTRSGNANGPGSGPSLNGLSTGMGGLELPGMLQ